MYVWILIDLPCRGIPVCSASDATSGGFQNPNSHIRSSASDQGPIFRTSLVGMCKVLSRGGCFAPSQDKALRVWLQCPFSVCCSGGTAWNGGGAHLVV